MSDSFFRAICSLDFREGTTHDAGTVHLRDRSMSFRILKRL